MQEKRSARFGKWLLKAAASYGAFISVGLLLSPVPASRLGLSEEVFFDLRMFLMLLGPIYLALIVKIILTLLTAVRGQAKGTAGAGSRHFAQGRRLSAVFLPVGLSVLILELLTLLVCIVTFAPLSRAASSAFLCTIALTALLLLMVPLVLSLLSGYRGDKAGYMKKRERVKQKAVRSDVIVLESDPVCRKRYVRLPKILALLVYPGVCLISGFVLASTKNYQHLEAVQLLRMPFFLLMAAAVFSLSLS